MSETTKTIADWEKERSMVITDKVDVTKKVTEAEFEKLIVGKQNWVGIDHTFREQWLKDNGYEVTRENLIDLELRSPEPADE